MPQQMEEASLLLGPHGSVDSVPLEVSLVGKMLCELCGEP
jgi:hypothetical protein